MPKKKADSNYILPNWLPRTPMINRIGPSFFSTPLALCLSIVYQRNLHQSFKRTKKTNRLKALSSAHKPNDEGKMSLPSKTCLIHVYVCTWCMYLIRKDMYKNMCICIFYIYIHIIHIYIYYIYNIHI